MTLKGFERNIRRTLVVEHIGKRACRCYFNGVMFAEKLGPCAVVTMIAGAGPNQQRMHEDFVEKIHGKIARVYNSLGIYIEFPVPNTLTV